MTRRVISAFGIALFLGFGLGLLRQPETGTLRADPAPAERIVFLASNLSDEGIITLGTAVAAGEHSAVVLLDTPKLSPYNKAFFAAYRPGRVVPVGSFPQGVVDLEQRLGVTTAPALEWKRGPPTALWQALFPQAERVVVCPAHPRGLLLQSATLAGAVGAPLFVIHGATDEAADLKSRLKEWKTREVFAVSSAVKLCGDLPGVRVTELADGDAVAASHLHHLAAKGPVQTLVVTNPTDTREELGGMSALAPWVAVQKRAALLLTNPGGSDVTAVVRAARKDADLAAADNLILLANHKAIPWETRPNPVPGKDAVIEMEPLTPKGDEPFTFATGRLFHAEPGVVALMLARQRLLAEPHGPRRALIVSNPGGGLPLLETFSRNTAREFHNAGYQTTALYEKESNKEDVRRLLSQQDIFMWEGHHKTMTEEYGVPEWTEPLQPAFVFLQSCLALNEQEAYPLLNRGALAVAGSSTRTYSGSGGAFTLSFFDALFYDDQTLGGALRQAKNFLLCYSLLKEKRLGESAKLSGANVRSSWAFTLWGDPTLKLPRPQPPADALPAFRHALDGNTIVLSVPEKRYGIITNLYESRLWPNTRLAGLFTQENSDDERRLVPFLFAEVDLSKGPADRTPQLHSRVPSKQWVFVWDAVRRHGYLLVTPRMKDQEELRFSVKWEK